MEKLKELRKKIDKVDADIIKNLAARQKLSVKIGRLKATLNMPVKDTKREAQQWKQYEKSSRSKKLQPDFIKRLFKIIIAQSKKLQKQ